VRAMKKKGYNGQFHNVSFVGSKALSEELGADGQGVVISQVVPFPFSQAIPVIREFSELAAKSKVDVNFSSVEGYLVAKVFAEGLKRAGKTPTRERERLYQAFRVGEEMLLVVSKVANFSIDLPEASVAIQVSGAFGSRQEEAQRLGRILRPKRDGRQAHFYTVVARDTNDQEFAARRQRFLAEQGYAYQIVDAEDVLDAAHPAGGPAPYGVSSRRARVNTASNAGSVSTPVKVFCWLGW